MSINITIHLFSDSRENMHGFQIHHSFFSILWCVQDAYYVFFSLQQLRCQQSPIIAESRRILTSTWSFNQNRLKTPHKIEKKTRKSIVFPLFPPSRTHTDDSDGRFRHLFSSPELKKIERGGNEKTTNKQHHSSMKGMKYAAYSRWIYTFNCQSKFSKHQ